jgi:ATP-dependent Lhr-like helicase
VGPGGQGEGAHAVGERGGRGGNVASPLDLLDQTRRRERTGEVVRVAAIDPLNLVGILTPGPRAPAQRGNLVVYRDGLPIGEGAAVVRAHRFA